MNTKYGFTVGDVVETKMQLETERGELIPAGSKIRIVAIAPKVRIVTGFRSTDSRQYFYNAVVSDQRNDYENRIRADFCTVYKKGKGFNG